jgi:CheY-like chemotaxis protein
MSTAKQPALPPVAPEIAATLAGRCFGVFGFDADETARISAILRKHNASATPFHELRLAESAYFGEALLVKLRSVSPQALRVAADFGARILLCAPGDVILQGLGGAYGWTGDLLAEPWPEAELPLRLFRLIAPRRTYGAHAASRSDPLVLLADDDPAWIALAETVLRHHHVVCCAATTGVEALRFARELLPDLLVLDLNMPGMDGFAVLHTIRQEPRLAHLPVVLLTGCNQALEVNRASALHADDYLVKPLSPAVLLNRIQRLLEAVPPPGLKLPLDHPVSEDWPFSAAPAEPAAKGA